MAAKAAEGAGEEEDEAEVVVGMEAVGMAGVGVAVVVAVAAGAEAGVEGGAGGEGKVPLVGRLHEPYNVPHLCFLAFMPAFTIKSLDAG